MFKKLGLDGEYIYNPTARLVARNAFRAGAEWQKQRMAEWLTEQKEQTSIGLSAYDMGEENGKIDMLGRAIQKLEEL